VVRFGVKHGRVELTYSSNALAALGDFFVGLKSLPSFRDVTLIPDCFLPKSPLGLITPETARAERNAQKNRTQILEALTDFSDGVGGQGPQKGCGRQKAKAVTGIIQKCMVDLNVSGERVYVSFFEGKSRDQVSKFVTPPVSLALLVHPLESPQEASFEVFGF